MPTTSNFGWTTPADTDLVKDGAAAIRTLGNGVDGSFIDLKGGTTGQVLSKATNADLDYTWITPNVGDITEVQAGTGISVASGTGPIPVITNTVATAFDAAGDLVYGTGADTFTKLSLGTAGQVLKVNSGATAPEWGAAASGTTFVGCALYSVSSQTISNSVYTAVTWDSERFDTDGFHSTSSNTSRITIPSGKGGKYLFVWNHHWHGSATGDRFTQLYKNGSATGLIDGGRRNNFNINAGNTQGSAQIVDATAGDYFEVFAQQTSGGNLGVTVANEYNQFSCVYLGA